MKTKFFPHWLRLASALVLMLAVMTAPIAHAGVALSWTDLQEAEFVLGQPDFYTNGWGTTASMLNLPAKAVVDPTTRKVFVADYNNNRVLRFASWTTLQNGAEAEAVLGQPDLLSNGIDCTRSTMFNPYGIWVDGSGRLWVADNYNNRVLRFDNASTKASGANADGVLGQPDFTTCTFAAQPDTMFGPADLQVDAAGRLWVADWYNNRVLRFDNAATKANGANADGVLGQPGFTSNAGATTPSGMRMPLGLVVDGSGNLFVADWYNNRVLRFDNAAAKANGASADGVLGQSDFSSKGAATSQTGMQNPAGLAADPYGRLYVADSWNNRILIYDNAATLANGAAASNVLGQPDFASNMENNGGRSASSLSIPAQLYFDSASGRLWVADSANNRVLRFAEGPWYQFIGFTAPVDNPDVMNVAKAGQAIPLKWRLLDWTGAPVTNLASTSVKVTAVGLSCSAGTSTDQIEQYAAGESGLQNLGNGYYQWNWKSPTSYTNSCKTLKLDLGEGVGNEHIALFQFKK